MVVNSAMPMPLPLRAWAITGLPAGGDARIVRRFVVRPSWLIAGALQPPYEPTCGMQGLSTTSCSTWCLMVRTSITAPICCSRRALADVRHDARGYDGRGWQSNLRARLLRPDYGHQDAIIGGLHVSERERRRRRRSDSVAAG